MEIFAIAFIVMVLACLGMALGAIMRKRPFVAGCGRAGALADGDTGCEICGRSRGSDLPRAIGAGVPARDGL